MLQSTSAAIDMQEEKVNGKRNSHGGHGRSGLPLSVNSQTDVCLITIIGTNLQALWCAILSSCHNVICKAMRTI
jgi:hypothetical protein